MELVGCTSTRLLTNAFEAEKKINTEIWIHENGEGWVKCQ